MDEMLYLLALTVGIIGAFAFWGYGRRKQRAVTRAIQKQKDDDKSE
jgi:drug/metabolite transporter superfamily protein YnfA